MARLTPLPFALCVLAFAHTAGALDWTTNGAARSTPLTLPAGQQPGIGFTAMPAAATGVAFSNLLPAGRGLTNQILLNGSGVTAGDIDGDGLADVFFAGLNGRSTLFRNLGGWRFENITATSGLALAQADASGCAFADLDGDGDLDLLVNSVGQGTAIYMNDGRGRYQFNASTPLLNRPLAGSSLALADLDGDGRLDLYVANYRSTTVRDQPGLQFNLRRDAAGQPSVAAINGRPLSDPEWTNRFQFAYRPLPTGGVTVLHDELGESDAVFRNHGQGRLVPQSWTNGKFLDEHGVPLARAPLDWGLAVMIRDLNGDGRPDIYVCNDFASPDRIWFGDGRGKFRAAPTDAIRHTSLSSMGIDVADVNRDGHDDLFIVDMMSREHWRRLVQRNEPNPNLGLFVDVAARAQVPHNTLQLARGDGTFADVAQLAGLEASEWSWTPIFLDVDLDGWEDVLVANGFERDNMHMDHTRRNNEALQRLSRDAPPLEHLRTRGNYPRLDTANAAFRNLGGLRFADVSRQWRFDTAGVSQGMCLADLDGDGDLDVLINNLNGPATLLRNDVAAPRVAVRLRGDAPNTRGIGARIRVRTSGLPDQAQEMICGGRYLSSDDAMRTFAAGSVSNALTLEITWRTGARTVIQSALPNRLYEIVESGAMAATSNSPPQVQPRFSSIQLPHSHAQTAFDEFARQPALPARLGTLGPGVSWIDIDADGRDDLVVATGRDSRIAVFRNEAGGFTRMAGDPLDTSVARNQTTVLAWHQPSGALTLLAGASNHEDATTNGSAIQLHSVRQATNATPLATIPSPSLREGEVGFADGTSSTGPLAMADVDGDGALDLFIGGRCIPGRWPEPASSRLFLQRHGRWLLDTNNSLPLASVGLVTAAVFSDIDGDGVADLLLACEWGPLKIFRNRRGTLEPWDAPVRLTAERRVPAHGAPPSTLNQLPGLWTGITTGDFDGDGRLDIVAGNWGRNTRYERHLSRPLHLHFGDFNGDGSVGIIEAGHDEAMNSYVPLLSLEKLSRSLPWLLERFPTAEAFGRARLNDVLGNRLKRGEPLEAAWLDSSVLLNRGDHFEVRSLPLAAQLAPAFGVSVADFDGDGAEDVFLSQNFFSVRPEHSRLDAGRGLLLRGDGRGGFTPIAGPESGLAIYGEGRGSAVCDFDGDGRTDLAVAQNSGPTKLFRNDTARPGLRVGLRGLPGNPHAIGAVVRVQFGDGRLGPARELHAGSGWWSSDSPVPVLATPSPAAALHVRWPGGRATTSTVPAGASAITVRADGPVSP